MDVVLENADHYVLDGLWSNLKPEWGRDNIFRQSVSLYTLTMIGVLILYFGIAGGSYFLMFDKRMMKHPRFIKGQIRMEIAMSVKGFPWLDLMTLPWFLGECRGWSKMYEGVENSPFGHGTKRGIAYIFLSAAFFLWFTDFMIYIVHRVLHWPSVYKVLHKPHHKWVIPTPFASHAFHPIDGYLQSLPYHMYVYMIPLHKYTYLGLFVFVNLWSIFIHDSDMIVGHPLEKIINGPAHHTLHHMHFVYNYGQYFTWADRAGGSYRHPQNSDDPLLIILEKEEQKRLMKEEKQKAIAAYELEKAQEQQQQQQQRQGKTFTIASSSSSSSSTASTPLMSRSVSTASSASPASSEGIQTPSEEKNDSGFEASSNSGTDEEEVRASATVVTLEGGKRQLRRRK